MFCGDGDPSSVIVLHSTLIQFEGKTIQRQAGAYIILELLPYL